MVVPFRSVQRPERRKGRPLPASRRSDGPRHGSARSRTPFRPAPGIVCCRIGQAGRMQTEKRRPPGSRHVRACTRRCAGAALSRPPRRWSRSDKRGGRTWATGERRLARRMVRHRATGGRFVRDTSQFRNWITAGRRAGPPARAASPPKRALSPLRLAGLPLGAPHADLPRAQGAGGHDRRLGRASRHAVEGWELRDDYPGATGDRLHGYSYLREVYLGADPEMSGRVTVPVLWDKQRETIVSATNRRRSSACSTRPSTG